MDAPYVRNMLDMNIFSVETCLSIFSPLISLNLPRLELWEQLPARCNDSILFPLIIWREGNFVIFDISLLVCESVHSVIEVQMSRDL